MINFYRFRESWQVAAPAADVQALLVDLEHYPDWWPQIRAVASLGPDDAWVVCRSALPYDLDLRLHAVHREPYLLQTTLDGDLQGHARWRLTEASGRHGGTRLDFDQEVRVTSRFLRCASVVAGPVLRWNHRQMMAGCRVGLERRLVAR